MQSFVVVTPVLNGARFICQALRSVSEQTDPAWVHYVVDGGSTDGTQELVRASMAGEPRRHLIEGPDGGMYDAIFRGFEAAASDGHLHPETICLWLNADDQLMPWAFQTLRDAFAVTRADWIQTFPCFWDEEGRLAFVFPYAWYARPLIRWSLVHGRALGTIQQESTFFTGRLLQGIDPVRADQIRKMKLAGDFVLWQEFARICSPVQWPTVVSGFRAHARNASRLRQEEYFQEILSSGVSIPPPWIARIMRILYRPFAIFQMVMSVRRGARAFEAKLAERGTAAGKPAA